jgi:hypothetical protein
MSHLAASAPTLASGESARQPDERLPIALSALIIVALSLGLWAGIGFLVRWAIG